MKFKKLIPLDVPMESSGILIEDGVVGQEFVEFRAEFLCFGRIESY
jgi:hypothetical protein